MTPPPIPASPPITPLTPAQKRVAGHLANGLTVSDIATQTRASVATVERHITTIRASLHCERGSRPPALLHRIYVTQQLPTPISARPAPDLTPAQLLLMRAHAERSAPRGIATAARIAPADLNDKTVQLLAYTGARDTTHLVVLGHGWGLLTAPARAVPSGARG